MSEQIVDGEDWVVVLYPQTGALRLYQGQALAKMHVATSDLLKYGYRSALDMQRRHDHRGLERLWRRLFEGATLGWPKSAAGPLPAEGEETPPDCSTERLARELWDLCVRLGDRVCRPTGSKVTSKSHHYVNVAKIRAIVDDKEASKAYPKQCRQIMGALLDLGTTYVSEDRLRKMMLELVVYGGLKTKQDAWLIWQFYRPRLITDGLVTRGNQDADQYDESDTDDTDAELAA